MILEEANLEIRYDHGKMFVRLEEFLSMRNKTKFKKLVRLIRQSYTPEEEQKILNYIEQFNVNYEVNQDLLNRQLVGYEEKIRFAEKQVQSSVAIRDKFKRNTENWKNYSQTVKQHREELQQVKVYLYTTKYKYASNQRMKVFLDQCAEFLQG